MKVSVHFMYKNILRRNIKDMERRISGHTQLYALIGSPVGHSGSPAMYNYSFEKLGIDAAYLAFDVPVDNISVRNLERGYTTSFSASTVKVSITALQSELSRLSANSITGYVDVSGLVPGTLSGRPGCGIRGHWLQFVL